MESISDFEDLLALLHKHGVRYLVIGGLAFIYHARPRYTKDMDLWIDPSPANVRRANAALADFGPNRSTSESHVNYMILVVFLRATLVYYHYMMSKRCRNPIPFDQPATYQISVQGQIDPSMSDLLGDMTISPDTLEVDHPVTILSGELDDQAALAGVLNILYEMHLTVLMVKRMENSEVAECDSRKTDAA